MNSLKPVVLLFLCLLLSGFCLAQTRQKEQREQKELSRPGAAWQRAIAVLERIDLDTVMLRCGLSPREARTVVFPEVLRYNTLQDRIEVMALKALYVQCGGRYANFSIGLFQMKPSFAEALERELMATGHRHFLGLTADTVQTADVRRRRLDQLQQPAGQVRYLALFLLVAQSLHPEMESMSATARAAFLATAYNYSYRASAAAIGKWQKRKEFHFDLLATPNTVWYNYAEVAMRYYHSIN